MPPAMGGGVGKGLSTQGGIVMMTDTLAQMGVNNRWPLKGEIIKATINKYILNKLPYTTINTGKYI